MNDHSIYIPLIKKLFEHDISDASHILESMKESVSSKRRE
jgi:hypothetical protein